MLPESGVNPFEQPSCQNATVWLQGQGVNRVIGSRADLERRIEHTDLSEGRRPGREQEQPRCPPSAPGIRPNPKWLRTVLVPLIPRLAEHARAYTADEVRKQRNGVKPNCNRG
jgi:hypothetical protein